MAVAVYEGLSSAVESEVLATLVDYESPAAEPIWQLGGGADPRHWQVMQQLAASAEMLPDIVEAKRDQLERGEPLWSFAPETPEEFFFPLEQRYEAFVTREEEPAHHYVQEQDVIFLVPMLVCFDPVGDFWNAEWEEPWIEETWGSTGEFVAEPSWPVDELWEA